MNQRLMAFWKYDLFPFLKGGEVEEFNNNESVKIKGSYSFFYSFILPYEKGVQLLKKLDDLEINRNREIAMVTLGYKAQLITLLEEYRK